MFCDWVSFFTILALWGRWRISKLGTCPHFQGSRKCEKPIDHKEAKIREDEARISASEMLFSGASLLFLLDTLCNSLRVSVCSSDHFLTSSRFKIFGVRGKYFSPSVLGGEDPIGASSEVGFLHRAYVILHKLTIRILSGNV